MGTLPTKKGVRKGTTGKPSLWWRPWTYFPEEVERDSCWPSSDQELFPRLNYRSSAVSSTNGHATYHRPFDQPPSFVSHGREDGCTACPKVSTASQWIPLAHRSSGVAKKRSGTFYCSKNLKVTNVRLGGHQTAFASRRGKNEGTWRRLAYKGKTPLIHWASFYLGMDRVTP